MIMKVMNRIGLLALLIVIGSALIYSTTKNVAYSKYHKDYPLEMDFAGERVPTSRLVPRRERLPM